MTKFLDIYKPYFVIFTDLFINTCSIQSDSLHLGIVDMDIVVWVHALLPTATEAGNCERSTWGVLHKSPQRLHANNIPDHKPDNP